MTDTVIKGTGNSRSIFMPPNAPTMFPTWESFVQQCSTQGAPIDLGPLNAAGVQTMGTDLTKANLLTDALCTALGIATTSTPTQAMDKLRQLVNTAQSTADAKAHIAYGNFSTTNAVVDLNFNFYPTFICAFGGKSNAFSFALAIRGYDRALEASVYNSNYSTVYINTDGSTVDFFSYSVRFNKRASITQTSVASRVYYIALG